MPLLFACLLLAQLLKFICNKLHLGSYDNLYAGLTWPDDAGNACGFDLLFVYQSVIFDLQP